MELRSILAEASRRGASDVHVKIGAPPVYRINGLLVAGEGVPLTRSAVEAMLGDILDDARAERLRRDRQVDLAYARAADVRLRVNVFMQRGEPRIALRLIPLRIRTIEELNLPPVVGRIADERRGIVLVTGTTGSGKSTTLAAMIHHINEQRPNHIITIEDPIEYVHQDRRSIIAQREIGEDATTFTDALRGALRQDPDVILVGEMRDLETIETAILAAETGHLVMSTLHTLDATETITRVIATFPEDQRDQVRIILANVLRGVISQRLLPRADGQGMVPAVEVLVSTARVRQCISVKEQTPLIRDAIAAGHSSYGMQTFDQSLMSLYHRGLVALEEALAHATNPQDFALAVRGVSSTSDYRWESFAGEKPEGGESGGLEIEHV